MVTGNDSGSTADVGGPPRPDECDLIMQGGVTSGVAYPAAVMQLYRKYRFRSIGGASAGAIAAAIVAAAEYARADGGFERLDEVRAELRTPGLLVQLFAPMPAARPLLRLLLAAQARRTAGAKAITYLAGLLWWLLVPVLAGIVAAFGVGWLLLDSAGGSVGGLDVLGWLVFAVVLLLSGALSLVLALGISLYRLFAVHLPKHHFGLVPGKTAGPKQPPALTDWLHAKIQYVAGRDLADPLTFADLAERGIQLRMMTTDVSWGRPVRMPDHSRSGARFRFDPNEFRALYPDDLVAALAAKAGPDPDHPRLCALPEGELPVLVATRMSLAFPLFLASIPLWTVEADGALRRHWIADGGATSNFPIHFFDAWLPTRPTFGLNFVSSAKSVTEPSGPTDQAPAQAVGYFPDGRPPTRFGAIHGVGGYLARLFDATHNWHDTLQAELPGFADRIAHIELGDGEGGFNLTMPPGDPDHPRPGTIARVEAKGAEAGRQLAGFDFPRHWYGRYLLAMRMAQRNLAVPANPGDPTVAAAFPPSYRDWLAAGAPGSGFPDRDADWYRAATAATGDLVATAERWLPDASGSFVDGPEPLPPSVMRVNPDV